MEARERGALPPVLLLGFAVGSAGGPLAIAAVYLLAVAHVPPPLLLPTVLLGLVLFSAPLTIWRDYSEVIASDGGLYAFVRRAAGERLARWQGWIWTLAYLLYLPYTVTYIVFYLLPHLVPLPPPAPALLAILLPVIISLLVAVGGTVPVALLMVSSAIQLFALALLAVLVLHGNRLAHPILLVPTVSAWPGVLGGAAQVASLLVCMSLVLFLGGGAAVGASSAIRWSLSAGFAILCGATLVSAVLLSAGATPAVAGSDIPGAVLGRLYGSPAVGISVGLLALVSIAGLIVAEFVGLIRLWNTMFHLREGTSVVIIAAFFIVGDAISLIGPRRFYTLTLAPSLIALYLSQLIVFGAYPFFSRRRGRGRSLRAVSLATVGCIWSLYGVYGVVAGRFLS